MYVCMYVQHFSDVYNILNLKTGANWRWQGLLQLEIIGFFT